LKILWEGKLFMIDDSQVPEIQQQMCGQHAPYAQYD
jgi:hypothetical protein